MTAGKGGRSLQSVTGMAVAAQPLCDPILPPWLCPCALLVLLELLQLQGLLRTGIQILSALCTWFSTFPHVNTLQQLHCFSSPFYFHNIFEGDLWNAESLTDFSLAPKCSLVTYIEHAEKRTDLNIWQIPSPSQFLNCYAVNRCLTISSKLKGS